MPPRPSAAGGESAYEKRLKKAFHLFDADGSGALSVDEIREVLTRQTGDTKLTEADVKEIIADFDTVSACARLPARVRPTLVRVSRAPQPGEMQSPHNICI